MEPLTTIKPSKLIMINLINRNKTGVLYMKTVILKGEEFITKEKFHEILKNKLDLPKYYGENLDALWDCLTTDIPYPVKIHWINVDKSIELLGDYAKLALDIFIKAGEEAQGNYIFTYEK